MTRVPSLSAAAAVQGVQDFYNRTNTSFQNLSDAVKGDQSAFKGQAGDAFSQLMDNLHQVANSAYTQMTTPNSYAQLITDAGTQSGNFLMSLWNAAGRLDVYAGSHAARGYLPVP